MYYASTKVRASGGDSMPFEISSGVRQGWAPSPTACLVKPCKATQGFMRPYVVLLSNSFREMHDLRETVNHHAAAVGMLIKASKTKVVSALMSDEICQVVLLDGDDFK